MTKRSFIMYTDFREIVEALSDEQAGMLFKTILAYESGEEPEPEDAAVRIAFIAAKQKLDHDSEKWEETKRARSEAGKAGAEKRWQKDSKNGTAMANDSKSMANDSKNGCNMLHVTCNMLSTIVDKYNRVCPSLPKCIKLTDKRKAKIKARLAEHDVDTIELAFRKAEASDFMKGQNDRGWKADLDWFMANDTNIVKVLEGKYDNRVVSHDGSTHERLENAFRELQNE